MHSQVEKLICSSNEEEEGRRLVAAMILASIKSNISFSLIFSNYPRASHFQLKAALPDG